MKDVRKERDESVGRMLGSALKARAAAEPAGACLDADALAAWADDTLSRSDRAAVEAHAADCARCQAMLAAMVRTLPDPAAARSPWRLPALGWLVPATAAAAAVLVWTLAPERVPKQQIGTGVATDQVTPATPADKAQTPELDARAPDRVASSTAQRDTGGNAIPREQAAAGAVPNSRTPEPQEAKQERRALEKDAPAAPAADALAKSTLRAREASPASPLAAPAPAPQHPAAAGAPVPPAAAAKSFALARAAAPTVIASPDPDVRWRIVQGEGVQHTTDGGTTWQTQQTGVSVTLTAGASPSSSVCWLAGPGGIVMLSTDGTTWRRIAFPETADLVAITATDERTATVTLAGGRTLTTTDGGVSWR